MVYQCVQINDVQRISDTYETLALTLAGDLKICHFDNSISVNYAAIVCSFDGAATIRRRAHAPHATRSDSLQLMKAR